MRDHVFKAPKWRRPTLPQARTCSQAEAIALLRRDVFDHAISSGLLHPCCIKRGEKRDSKVYAVSAVQRVEDMLLDGSFWQTAGGAR